MAEKIAIDAARCVIIPDTMPFDEASAFILTYGTAYYALKHRGTLRSGETLLVLGAAGGVGLAAIEIGKAIGARVVAAVSTAEKARLVQEHGADRAVIYDAAPFGSWSQKELVRRLKEACEPNGADVVCDVVGGEYSEAALRAIAWDGRFLVVGFTAGIPHIALNLPLLKSCQIIGVFWGHGLTVASSTLVRAQLSCSSGINLVSCGHAFRRAFHLLRLAMPLLNWPLEKQ